MTWCDINQPAVNIQRYDDYVMEPYNISPNNMRRDEIKILKL